MQVLGVHHVSVNVGDVAAAKSFYVDVLGLVERDDRPDFRIGGAWLDAGGQQVHLVEGVPPADLGQHLALQVADLDEAIATLRSRGVEVSAPLVTAGARQAFLHDPAGNLVELNQPTR